LRRIISGDIYITYPWLVGLSLGYNIAISIHCQISW